MWPWMKVDTALFWCPTRSPASGVLGITAIFKLSACFGEVWDPQNPKNKMVPKDQRSHASISFDAFSSVMQTHTLNNTVITVDRGSDDAPLQVHERR